MALLCPMKQSGDRKCDGDKCAWWFWTKWTKTCAVLHIAAMLNKPVFKPDGSIDPDYDQEYHG